MSRGWRPWTALSRLLRREPAREIEEELRHHLEERERDYVSRGMDPAEARRAARERMGPLEDVKAECEALLALERREEERRAWAHVSGLDVKLGLRMLAKHPGMSVVSVVAMAVAVALGAGAYGSVWSLMNAELPLPGGDAVVAIEMEDAQAYGSPYRQILHDFAEWRGTLESLVEVSAFRDATHNLIAADGATELVRVAEITASGLAVARTPPLMGRPLVASDEQPGAEPVVVIGYDEWQRRFGGSPDVIGSRLRLGPTLHEVVGVMPEGFRFPLNHGLWTPFRYSPTAWDRGDGPAIHVFGRLADGRTLEQAQAELATLGVQAAAAHPESHQHLRPRVVPYTFAFGVDVDSPDQAFLFRSIPWAVALLLVLVSVNVAILVYARTATRVGEITVRSALGASRARIVGQLFVEALIPSVLAAAVGLAVAAFGLEQAEAWLRRTTDRVPFWWDLGVSPGTALYVAGLAVVAGAIIGVVPGLKATGAGVAGRLKRTAGRGPGMQLGGTWTTLIVAQVAVAVTVLPFAVYMSRKALVGSSGPSGYAASELIRAGVSMAPSLPPPGTDPEARRAARDAHFREATAELIRRLEEASPVTGVTFATHFPGGGRGARIEADDGSIHDVTTSGIGPGFFDVIDVPLLAGPGFDSGDFAEGARAVVVDRRFAEQVFGSPGVVGRRVRRLVGAPDGDPAIVQPGPWLEVVGVAPPYGVQLFFEPALPTLYEPLPLERASSAVLAVRVPGDPSAFQGRLRAIAAAVDPELQLSSLETAAAYERTGVQALRFLASIMAAVTAAVLLLSAAGISAMMSFTVARRRREIGIRTALGASRRRVLTGIFAGAARQLALGLVVGLALATLLDRVTGVALLSGSGVMLLPAVAALMTAAGLLATYGPARRGLAVEPTEAMREE